MKLSTILLLPFKFFAHGNSRHSGRQSGHEGSPDHSHRGRAGRGTKGLNPGWGYGNMLVFWVSFVLTSGLFLYLAAYIETTRSFLGSYGTIGLYKMASSINIPFPTGGEALFYREVLARAVCSSGVALVQIIIFYFVIFSGMKMLLQVAGSTAAGKKHIKFSGTQTLMGMAMLMLPALGILSTVFGILGADHLSKQAAKFIIFGPSGLGILGYLIATFFSSIAEYFNEQ